MQLAVIVASTGIKPGIVRNILLKSSTSLIISEKESTIIVIHTSNIYIVEGVQTVPAGRVGCRELVAGSTLPSTTGGVLLLLLESSPLIFLDLQQHDSPQASQSI